MRKMPTHRHIPSERLDQTQSFKSHGLLDDKAADLEAMGRTGDTKRDTDESNLSSTNSQLSQILATKRRLIFKYPDGTFSYAYRCQKGSTIDEKAPDAWL